MDKHTEIFEQYSKGVSYKTSIGLFDTVKQNENFFVGRQWEGVQANGLPTPVFNFIKRVIMFLVSSVISESIALSASAISDRSEGADICAEAINLQFQKVFERCDLISKIRVFLKNAAVDGDSCIYLRYDPDNVVTGGIEMEIIDNTRVFFGNPTEVEVQRQPYIILSSYEYIDDLKRQMLDNRRSGDEANRLDAAASETDPLGVDRAVLLLRLRRDPVNGHILACEATENMTIREEWDTGLTQYPLVWMSWERVKDCYHGQAAVSGLVPNQIFVNKLFAMAMISMMSTAYPKVVYDSTRIASWDNRVGTAVPVAGGDVGGVAAIINPAQISPQVHEFIDSAINYTREFMGATDASLGLVRPDNTSAILALQRASQVPLALIRQEMYQCVENIGRIVIDICAAYMGRQEVNGRMFDYAGLSKVPFAIKLDAGASSYWSEIASMQSLDNLLTHGLINAADYLERVPAGMIPKKEELIEALRGVKPEPAM